MHRLPIKCIHPGLVSPLTTRYFCHFYRLQDKGAGGFPPRPLSAPDLESLLAVDELRIGLHAALGQVDAVVLLLLGDADTDHRLEDAPDDQTGDEHPHEDGDDTEQLAHQGGVLIAGQTDSQETPDAHHAVYGDGADGIVDLDLVH